MDKFILEKRPSLSPSSVKTYNSILRTLYTRVFGTPEESFDYSKFTRSIEILAYLKDLSPSKRKTVLSALVVVTGLKDYKDKMLLDIQSYNCDIDKQKKTVSQEENWVSPEEVKDVLLELQTNANLLYKKKTKTAQDLQNIQNYIILCLMSGIYIVPRRSKDYTDFKIKGINTEKDNYMSKNKLIFNSYKTAKYYGQQTLVVPKELACILRKWEKINETEYLLFDAKNNQLTSVKLNQRLNKIFGGKKVACIMLRHSYLTGKFEKTSEEVKKMDEDLAKMGSSAMQANLYIKTK